MSWNVAKLILKILVPLCLVLAVGYIVYTAGSHRGQDLIQGRWDKEREARAKARAKQRADMAKAEMVHQKKDEEIVNALVKLQADEARDIARISGELALRLRDSELRGQRYLIASEGSAVERSRLASHAAELDKALAEGIAVVGELRSTLEVRDGQLRQLGAQIEADRQLISGVPDQGSE